MPDLRSILIIRPSALGDVCRSVALAASLRRAYPEAQIDWLVQSQFADALWHHPAVNALTLFNRREMGRGIVRGDTSSLRRLVRELRRPRYDLVVDAQGLARSAFFAWATGAHQRIGFARPEARELAWLAYTKRVEVDPALHTVDKMLTLAPAAGAEAVADMRLYTGPRERSEISGLLATRGFDLAAARYAVLAPTSRWPGKRWPAERFAQVASAILEDAAIEAVLVVGARSEREQCGPLLELAAREARIIDLIGGTDVGELMVLIQSSALVIANDSAALHMAVGFDRPLIALYGPTDVSRVGPYKREADVIQHITPADTPDHKNERAGVALMERIAVEEVIEAARARL